MAIKSNEERIPFKLSRGPEMIAFGGSEDWWLVKKNQSFISVFLFYLSPTEVAGDGIVLDVIWKSL
jgi:hypothetical protein